MKFRSKEQNDHWRQIREKQEEKNRLLQEAEQKKEKDLADFKALLQQSIKWYKTNFLRDYLNAMEQKAIANNTVTEKFTIWLSWARQKADWHETDVLSKF